MTRARYVGPAWLLIVGLLATVVVTQWRLDTGLSAFTATGNGLAERILTEQFRGDNALARLLLIKVDGPSAASHADQLAEVYAGLPGVSLAASGPSERLVGGNDTLFRYRYLLSPRVEEGLFQTDRLRVELKALVERLRRPVAGVDEDRAAADPTGEFAYLLQRWFGSKLERSAQWQTQDGSAILIVRPEAPAYDTQSQAELLRRLRSMGDETAPEATIEITGPPAIAVAVRDAIRSDIRRVSALAGIGVVLLLLLRLRQTRALLYCLLPVASAAIAGVAAVVTVFGGIHGITLGFGGMLLGITVDYPLHLLGHAGSDGPHHAMRVVRRPLVIGAGSTAVGLLGMVVSGITGLQQVALFAAVGIVAALATTLWVLPALPWQAKDGAASAAISTSTSRLSGASRQWLALAIVAGLLTAGGWSLTQLDLQGDLRALSPLPADRANLDGELRAALDLPEPRYLIALHGDEAKVMKATDRISKALDARQSEGAVGTHSAVTDIIPPPTAQRGRRRELPTAETLETRLLQATTGLDLNAEALDPFVTDVQASRQLPWLRPTEIRDGLVGDWVTSLYRREGEQWLSLLRITDARDMAELTSRAEAIAGASVTVIGMDTQRRSNAMMTAYQRQAGLYSSLGLAIMLTLVAVSTGSARQSMRAAVIIASGLGAAVSLVAATGGQLTLFHLCSLLLIAGLGLDYALFTDGDRRGRASTAVCAASSVIGFGAMTMAATPVVSAVGTTVLAGVAGAWLTAMLLPARSAKGNRDA